MRIAICHTRLSGYVAACWRALAKRGEFDLRILAYQPDAPSHTAFGRELVEDLPCRLLNDREYHDAELVRSLVVEHRPDIVYITGWATPAYSKLPFRPELASSRFIMGMDTSIAASWRQRLARLKIGRYIDRMDRVVVIGERAWQTAALRLHVPESKIRRYLYGCDYDRFAAAYQVRLERPDGWPRRFLNVGRYAAEKGVDVLMEGFRRYRTMVSQPWALSCCGRGPLREVIATAEGVSDLGFVQPGQQAGVFASHGVFIMPSVYEPWGLAIAEAAASGLPIICSDACGAVAELLRPYYNGLSFATGDADVVARAMRWMHEHHDRLPEMGRRGQDLARPFGAQTWAEQWSEMFKELAADM